MSRPTRQLECSECQRRFPAREVLFLCPDPTCEVLTIPPPDLPRLCEGRPMFRAATYAETVSCPRSPHLAYLKFCPYCGALLLPSTGPGRTIAIIGSTVSGKTCFTAGLIWQVRRELSSEIRQAMSLEWDDDASKQYFTEIEKAIYRDGTLPEATQRRHQPRSLRITIRFPIRGWWRSLWHGRHGTVSLMLPDPSGEFFVSLQDVYTLTYLGNAGAYILMVDPHASENYRKGQSIDLLLEPATSALRVLVDALRKQLQQPSGLLPRVLAIALTKCDEPGLFDPDASEHHYQWPTQGRFYDPRLARAVGRRVEQHLREDLGMSEMVSLARNNFQTVEFFATSALGRPPERDPRSGQLTGRVVEAKPRRVEEPLLWVLHKWGYL